MNGFKIFQKDVLKEIERESAQDREAELRKTPFMVTQCYRLKEGSKVHYICMVHLDFNLEPITQRVVINPLRKCITREKGARFNIKDEQVPTVCLTFPNLRLDYQTGELLSLCEHKGAHIGKLVTLAH